MDITPALRDIIRYAAETFIKKHIGDRSRLHKAETPRPVPKFIPPEVLLEPPKDKVHGDLSTNVAMQIGKAKKGVNPLEAADCIITVMKEEIKRKGLGDSIEKVERKPPGFIKLYQDFLLPTYRASAEIRA